MANQQVNRVAPAAPAFTKGQSVLIPCFGSVGGVVTNFETKDVIPGSYRHTQTVNGTSYSWKCAKIELTGVVKLVYDTFQQQDGTVQGFWRMEGLVNDVAVVTNTRATMSALEDMAF